MSRYPVMSYGEAHKWEPLAAKRGVSEVARSSRGFMRAYQAAGSFANLHPYWKNRRDGFIARHMAQAGNENLWKRNKQDEWEPSRRGLALIMWAFMPPGRRSNPPTKIKVDAGWVKQWMDRLLPEVEAAEEDSIQAQWKHKTYLLTIYRPYEDATLIWTAAYRGKVVGIGTAMQAGDGITTDVAAVLPAHQRKGIYKAVLLKLKEVYDLPLYSGAAQTGASSALWKSLGAVDTGAHLKINPWRRPRPPTKKAVRAAHRTVYIDHPDAWPEPYDGDEAKANERALAAFTRRAEEERQEKARAKAGSLHDSLDRVERMIQQTRRNPKKGHPVASSDKSADDIEQEARARLLKLRELVEWRKQGECVIDARRFVYKNEDVPADYDWMIADVVRLLRANAKYYDTGDGASIRSMERRIGSFIGPQRNPKRGTKTKSNPPAIVYHGGPTKPKAGDLLWAGNRSLAEAFARGGGKIYTIQIPAGAKIRTIKRLTTSVDMSQYPDVDGLRARVGSNDVYYLRRWKLLSVVRRNPSEDSDDPQYLGTKDRASRVPKTANDGDTIVVWRDEYNRWECWVYDAFNKHWAYAGQDIKKDPMIDLAKDLVR